jgi:hypothetical protein
MELYKKGLGEMAAAVALAPDNVGVVIPRGATLLIGSRNVPGENGKELLRMGLAASSVLNSATRAFAVNLPA